VHPEATDPARHPRLQALRAQGLEQPALRAGVVAVGDPVEVVDVGQRDGPGSRERVVRGQEQVDHVVAEPGARGAGGDGRGQALPVLDHGEVEVAGEHGGQRLLGLPVGEDDAQVGVGGAQAGERGRGERVHRGGDRADAQLAHHLVAQPVEVESRGGDPGEDVGGVLGEHPSGGGEPQAPARRFGEGGTRLALELRQLLRHRRGREVQGRRRAGDGAVGREGLEGPEPVEREHGSDSNESDAGTIAGAQWLSPGPSRA
jgi:hypothetical protein